jgi:hypothetical protein
MPIQKNKLFPPRRRHAQTGDEGIKDHWNDGHLAGMSENRLGMKISFASL